MTTPLPRREIGRSGLHSSLFSLGSWHTYDRMDFADAVAMLREAVPDAVGVVLGINTRQGNVVLGDRYRTLWGENTVIDTLCGLTFRLSVPSFYQVNRTQAEVLYGLAVSFAGLTKKETVLDLYCGTGTITSGRRCCAYKVNAACNMSARTGAACSML